MQNKKYKYRTEMHVICRFVIFIQSLFVLWIFFRLENHITFSVRSMSRDPTCKRHDCHQRGTCLIGKCFCRPNYEGIDCEIILNRSIDELCTRNDNRCLVHPLYGIGEVPQERWEKAVSAERVVWEDYRGFNDRWDDHLSGFNNYKMLPDDLGNMLEMGCGPYTQTLSILRLKNKHVNISQLVLWDPNAKYYMNEVRHCSYTDGTLRGFDYIPTAIITSKSEEMHSYIHIFDTILMINVLEHVQNSYKILQNLYNALKMNGILIFGERWWDHSFEEKNYETENIHPIRIKYYVWKWFTDHFVPLYDARNHVSYLKYGCNGSYFIGRKKHLS